MSATSMNHQHGLNLVSFEKLMPAVGVKVPQTAPMAAAGPIESQ